MRFFGFALQTEGVIKKKYILEKWQGKEIIKNTGNGIVAEEQSTDILFKIYLLVIIIDNKEATAIVSRNDYCRAIAGRKVEIKYKIKNRRIKITKVII